MYRACLIALAAVGVCLCHGQTTYNTGFDPPTFTNGAPLNGVDTWSAVSAFSITDARARMGTQSALISENGSTTGFLSASKHLNPMTTHYAITSAYLYIPDSNDADTLFGLAILNGNTVIGGIAKAANGNFYGVKESGIDFGNILWTDPNPTNSWKRIYMHFQLGTSDLTYIIDEDFEHLDLGQTYATATGSMLFAYRSGAGNADIEANFDDYALRNVPEPASATGIALGLLAIVRRRKISRR